MDLITHIIDPEGEVIIILRNANSPFAQLTGDACTHRWLDISQLSFGKPLSSGNSPISQGLTGIPIFNYKPLEPNLKVQTENRDKRKGKKRRSFAEESAAEDFAAEEPPVEATTAEEPVVEGHIDQSCSLFQVSAKHLMFASPFFKRLLTGGWKGSTAYFQKRSVEITAEGWDVEALKILLRAIHGQYSHIPRKLTLEMLAKVAVIADYYECREALEFLAELWIEKVDEQTPSVASRDLILWLWISWFFRLPSQFKLSTSIAMSQSDGRIDNLGLPIPEDVLGERMYILLNA
ncbi:uncharacterized protein N7496_005748 [Penicillium cataractarum]|uniref:BTB domain-containing protein n=1 Tax=Penicillium cataractarum TaxID=2100454 RepID=A0A9W9VEZ9_9EURO|nr:uncharacterized protein N7496_005748 [Penicillium cataractarum]KAJ5378339.1 hypothetical protein N7496_005748 [Penicillium cataractarum]